MFSNSLILGWFKGGATSKNAFDIGAGNSVFYYTDFDTGALPTGWAQSTATGGTVSTNQAAETGMIGQLSLNTSGALGSRSGVQYSTGVNYLLNFMDGVYTQQIWRVRTSGLQTQNVIAFGWLNTNGPASPAALGNSLCIMRDPANNTGFNPGLITNLFLLARSVYGGPTGNTVVDLGVTLDGTWRTFEIFHNAISNQVRVFRDNVLLATLTNMANVPGGSVRGPMPVAVGSSVQATVYTGNSTAVIPAGTSNIRVDKLTIYKQFA